MANARIRVAKSPAPIAKGWRRLRAATRVALTLLTVSVLGSRVADAQVNVTTQHNDIGRTGQNLNETILTTSNVNLTQFGKLFSQPVDGEVYAQPLYLSGITINGAVHNVVFIGTEHDSVYAFDADTNGGGNSTPLWQASMLSPVHGAAANATTVSATMVGTQDIPGELGITGTPVIDPTTGTLYVVSNDFENGGAVQRLHALSIFTGAEKFNGPLVITGSVLGTGTGSVNGSLTFDSLWQNQRPGLLLLNGIVYVGFAANADNGPWHGWIFTYNAATLRQTGVYNTSPNGTGSGVWMSGTGLAADQLDPVNHAFGRMFVPTGNGDYNATSPYNSTMDYGDSVLDLDLTNGIPTVTDEFTAYNQATLDAQDLDLGSGGLLVLPTQTGTYPHLTVQAGKGGSLYLLNRDDLGGYSTTTDHVVQMQPNAVGQTGVWSAPAYWNGNVYYWGRLDHLKAFPLVNGLLSTTPTQSSEPIGFPGSTPSISANGTTQGIVWDIDSEGAGASVSSPAILFAHDASNVSTTLYASGDIPARDSAGPAAKFAVPTIANGKVYVGTADEVDIYGLLSSVTHTPAPTFNPGGESIAGTVNVAITDANPNASIYYTINGAPATTSATLYTGPIPVNSTETINAIASASGQLLSAQSSASYTSTTETLPVVFSLPTGTYGSLQVISLSDPTPNATVYYTTNGSAPTTGSSVYSTPITVNATETITAMAIAPGLPASPVAAATYTIQEGQTGIDFPLGFAESAGVIIQNGSTDMDDTRLQLTDGLPGESGSAWYYASVDVQSFTTTFGFQLSNPGGNGITFTIQNAPAGIHALGSSGAGLGYASIPNSIAIKFDFFTPVGQGTDSTGLYINGAVPTVPAIDLSSTPINLHSGDAMSVTLVYNNSTSTLNMTITDLVTTQTWSTSWTISIPATIGSTQAFVGFTGSTGSQTASQKILTWNYVNNYPPPVGHLDTAVDSVTGTTAIDSWDNLIVTGWIADPTDGSPMKNVQVLIDGIAVGTPTLGVSRTDVAAAQNNPAYALSGFTLAYPGSSLAAGTHVVTVVGTDSHGVLTTLNPITIGAKPPVGHLDTAVDSVTGTTAIDSWDNLIVTGWIADPTDGSPMKNVQVLIDGVSVGTPTLGLPRPDVAAAWSDPAFANSGFTLVYPGSSLAAGTHVVTVVGTDSHGVSTTLNPITIGAKPPVGHLDTAVDSVTGTTAIDSWDNLIVTGWIADPTDGSPMKNVQVLIDGVSVGTPTLGLPRPDVAAAWSDPAFANSGFTLVYPGSSLAAGTHVVTVVGTDSHGVSTTLNPITIGAKPPVGHLDTAVDSVTGTTAIDSWDNLIVTGWIADPTDGSPMKNVQVLIDGVSVGTPTLGLPRPDVVAAQNNPAYALSGFSLAYPGSSLAAGTHVVTVVGTDSHGVSTTLNPITIGAKPPLGHLDTAVDSVTGSTTINPSDMLAAVGWIGDPTDGSPMKNVQVLIDGVSVGTPTLGLPRPDVVAAQNNPAYALSGFSLAYPGSSLTAGTHVVTVVGTNSHSVSTTLGPLLINVAAASQSRWAVNTLVFSRPNTFSLTPNQAIPRP